MFPKCSLAVPNIVTLREHSANIPGISRAGWEAVAQRCSIKKMFLEILQNSQENTCVRVSFLIKSLFKESILKEALA